MSPAQLRARLEQKARQAQKLAAVHADAAAALKSGLRLGTLTPTLEDLADLQLTSARILLSHLNAMALLLHALREDSPASSEDWK